MDQFKKIDIDFSFDRKKKLVLPSEIRVPLGTIIQWEVLNTSAFRQHRLIFEVYFTDKSPFGWKNNSLRLEYSIGRKLTLQSRISITRRIGDFKYGVKAYFRENMEILEDDDPYLIVY